MSHMHLCYPMTTHTWHCNYGNTFWDRAFSPQQRKQLVSVCLLRHVPDISLILLCLGPHRHYRPTYKERGVQISNACTYSLPHLSINKSSSNTGCLHVACKVPSQYCTIVIPSFLFHWQGHCILQSCISLKYSYTKLRRHHHHQF